MSKTATPIHQRRLTHRQILVVFSGLALAMLVAGLSLMIVGTALPTIVGELGGLQYLSWVVTVHLLTSTASTPLFGKISDIYGRKPVFQAAILIFIAGSALAGTSQNMAQLIAFRALQGVGAGGLMALSMVIIGDVVSPRERGRYQGYIGATWAVVSILGPLIGGFLVDNLTWRWCFWVTVPLGLAALAVSNRVLVLPHRRERQAVDYLGASLLLAAVSSLLTFALWGGSRYAWTSPRMVVLGLGGVALLAAFVLQESKATDPILPLRLFRNSVFIVVTVSGFVMGMAMFGSMIFIPVFLQVVGGESPTSSGLLLVPLMGGMMISSITSGRIISRTGRHRIFPILGTAVMAIGLTLIATMDQHTSRMASSSYLGVMGIGLGMVMQVLVVAVQNSVEHRDLGIATASSQFFRQMGGAVGTTVFGAIMTSGLSHHLPRLVSKSALASLDASAWSGSPARIYSLPEPVRSGVIEAFSRSLHVAFVAAIPLAAIAFVVVLFLKELPLREWPDLGLNEVSEELGMLVTAEAEQGVAAGRDRHQEADHALRREPRQIETWSGDQD